MTAAARGLLWRFDTGDWSRYELGGGYAKRGYQVFVTTLLGKLASADAGSVLAGRGRPLHQLHLRAAAGDPARPAAGARRLPAARSTAGSTPSTIPFTLSKRASVTLVVAGKVFTWSRLGARRTHVLTWKPGPDVQPGTYPVTVRAVDFGGNHSTTHLAPVTVAWDTAPPPLEAQADASDEHAHVAGGRPRDAVAAPDARAERPDGRAARSSSSISASSRRAARSSSRSRPAPGTRPSTRRTPPARRRRSSCPH